MRTEQAHLIGSSHPMLELRQEIERIARSDAKVLITGESGVGKELVARAIHTNSPRAERPFVAVNCAGLPETLLESELFGHVKGSFTGAYRDKPGKLETADEGTIFLDEVGEMTLRMQGLLLRFLETGELQKVGSERAGRRVDVRVIAATNRNLQDLIAQGQFREDLYYRLNVIHFWVPPLRERKEDIPEPDRVLPLAASPRTNGYLVKGIEPDAFQALCDYPWPGNVRELENVIERLIVTGRHEMVRVEDLPPEIRLQRGLGAQAEARASPDRRRRPVQAAARRSRVVLDRGLPALHGARDHPAERPRRDPQGARGSQGQLQDRLQAVQHGVGRLQEVPELPAEARLPASVQGVPSVSEASAHVRDVLRAARAAVRSHDEPALPLPHAAPSRGAEHAALRPVGAARPDDARSATPARARRPCCAPRSAKSAGPRTATSCSPTRR